MYCYNVSVLNIGLFQFSSQISVTLVSVLFTPPLVNPIFLVRECFYLLVSSVFSFVIVARLYMLSQIHFNFRRGREVKKFKN